MSNIFKTNNRFHSLNDSFVNENVQRNKVDLNKTHNTNAFKHNVSISKKLEITEESFPTLTGIPKNVIKDSTPCDIANTTSFLDKLNAKQEMVEEINLEEKPLEPGWVEIKRDPNTGRIIANTSNNTIEKNSHFAVLDYLVSLHQKRTQEYIENWGKDEYENMFLFPNYEYGYFDRLDEEEYEKEQKEYEKYCEENNYEDYENYNSDEY